MIIIDLKTINLHLTNKYNSMLILIHNTRCDVENVTDTEAVEDATATTVPAPAKPVGGGKKGKKNKKKNDDWSVMYNFNNLNIIIIIL